MKPTTWACYDRMLRLHVPPVLGDRPMHKRTSSLLNSLYADLIESGYEKECRGGGLNPKTVRHIHSTLHKILGDAIDAVLLTVKPADRAKPPRPRASTPAVPMPDRKRYSAVTLQPCSPRKATQRERAEIALLENDAHAAGQAVLGVADAATLLLERGVDIDDAVVADTQERLVELERESKDRADWTVRASALRVRARLRELTGDADGAVNDWATAS